MVIVPMPQKNEEKASIEKKTRNFFKSQSPFRGAKVGFFLSPRASIVGESSEFFQVLYRGGKQSLKQNEEIWGKYDEI